MSSIFPLAAAEIRLRKDLGSDAGGVTAHTKLDDITLSVNGIQSNTSSLGGDISAVAGDVTTLLANLAIVDGVVDGIQADLDNTTDGLGALHTLILVNASTLTAIDGKADSIEGKVDNVKTVVDANSVHLTDIKTAIGDRNGSNLFTDIEVIKSQVDQIQNNTRTTIALLSEMEAPEIGQERIYKIQLNNYDVAGNPSEPESVPHVVVESFGGASRVANLVDDAGVAIVPNGGNYEMISDPGDGRYHINYKITDSHALNEGLLFTFSVTENATERLLDRVSRVVEDSTASFTPTDRNTINSISTDVGNVQSTADTIIFDISMLSGDVANNFSEIESNGNDISTLQSSIDDTQGAGFDTATDSLEAISNAIAALSANTSASQKVFEVTATTTSIAETESDMVALSVNSDYNIIKELRVIPTAGGCNEFSVQICEDSAGNAANTLLYFEKAKPDKGDLRLACDLIYINKDGSQSNKIFVKVTNEDATGGNTFNVVVRGIEASA